MVLLLVNYIQAMRSQAMNDISEQLKEYSKKVLHSTNKRRRADQFSVSFKGLPENISNILSKCVTNIERPTYAVDYQVRRGGGKVGGGRFTHDKHQIQVQTISLGMIEDDEGLVEQWLMLQYLRQENMIPDYMSNVDIERFYKFNIEVTAYNSKDQIIGTTIYNDCMIVEVIMGEYNYSSEEENVIGVTLTYDNITFDIAPPFRKHFTQEN